MPISFEMNPYPTKKTSSPKGGQSWRPTKRFVSISIEIHALPYVMRILVASWEKILQLLLRDLTTYLFQFLPSLLFLLFLFRFFDVTANRKHSYEEIYWFQRDLWEFHNSISLLCVHYFAFVFSFFFYPIMQENSINWYIGYGSKEGIFYEIEIHIQVFNWLNKKLINIFHF